MTTGAHPWAVGPHRTPRPPRGGGGARACAASREHGRDADLEPSRDATAALLIVYEGIYTVIVFCMSAISLSKRKDDFLVRNVGYTLGLCGLLGDIGGRNRPSFPKSQIWIWAWGEVAEGPQQNTLESIQNTSAAKLTNATQTSGFFASRTVQLTVTIIRYMYRTKYFR